MEYHEAVNFLFDLRRFQVKPGTESVRALLSHVGDPHESVTCVQVAGTNGKGSTARMVESVLREAGYTVGLYTSPHFENLRERIRIDGRPITETAVTEFVTEVRPYLVEESASGRPLTFFEVMTAMSLWQFGRRDVDVAVLEVGMGGKLDATSVVDPTASAVTNVTLEHTDVLGDTIEEIATKKAAVAPADAPLVTAATGEALDVVRREAGDVVTVGLAADGDDEGTPAPDVSVTYHGRQNHVEAAVDVATPDRTVEARIPLLGSFQALNAGIAVALVEQLSAALPEGVAADAVTRGLRNAHWPGRFEVMRRDPLVVLDGAHNPGACAELASVLAEFDYDALHLVFGAMSDKDHRGMVEALPAPDSVVTCEPVVPRAERTETLARVFEAAGHADVTEGEAVADALATARERADAGDCVVVVGSLYGVAEARTTWTRTPRVVSPGGVDDAEAALRRAHVPASHRPAVARESVHRTLTLRVQERQAEVLREELRARGGAAAVSGHEDGGELLDVVCAGTLEQFDDLTASLSDAPHGLSGVAADVRARVGLDSAGAADVDGRSDDEPFPWERRPSVMGILNVTPDSFHDGGEYVDVDDAVARAKAMVEAGADIVDVGGESTRPGATPVSPDEEKARVVPVVEAIADLDVHVSVDTRRAEVGRAALDAGADVLNDVTGLEDPEMRFLAAERGVPVIVMHSIDAPVVPGREVAYDDVVADVVDDLRERVLLAEKAGIPRENVIVDPGLGFGKSKAENFELLGRIDEFHALGCPVLVGHSHKSMFELVGAEAGDNPEATLAATAVAVERGADIVRVHDVEANAAAVRVARAAADPTAFEE